MNMPIYGPKRLTYNEMEGMTSKDLVKQMASTAAYFEKPNSIERLIAHLPEADDIAQFVWTTRYKQAAELIANAYRHGYTRDSLRKQEWFTTEEHEWAYDILSFLLTTLLISRQHKLVLATYVYTRFFYQGAS